MLRIMPIVFISKKVCKEYSIEKDVAYRILSAQTRIDNKREIIIEVGPPRGAVKVICSVKSFRLV